MQEHLLRVLIAKNHFNVAAEVDATYKGVDFSGATRNQFETTFTVTAINESAKTGRLLIDLISTRDGSRHRIYPEMITKVEGMTPERFAENYMIAPDGSEIKISGKRRGRRPKGWVDPDLLEG
jgi:hypothetical protein